MALNLIEIKDFPKTASLTGAGEEIIPVSKADGKTYGIKTSDFKAFLGTVQVIAPKALAPTDPAPTLDGVYIPTTNGTYANAGGLTLDFSEGGADYGMMTQFIKNSSVWVKSSYPLPKADNKINQWMAQPYTAGQQVLENNVWYEAVVNTTAAQRPGVVGEDVWKKVTQDLGAIENEIELIKPDYRNGLIPSPAFTKVDGKYITNTGVISTNAPYAYYEFINEGLEYYLTGGLTGTPGFKIVHYFDKNNTFISNELGSVGSAFTYTDYKLTIPSTTHFIRVNANSSGTVVTGVQTDIKAASRNYVDEVNLKTQELQELIEEIKITEITDMNPEYQEVLNTYSVLPSLKVMRAQNKMISLLKEDELWDKIDVLQVYATSSIENALVNLKKPNGKKALLIKTPVFEENKGFKGVVSTGACVNTNFTPSIDGINVQLESHSYLIGVNSDIPIPLGTYDMGGHDGIYYVAMRAGDLTTEVFSNFNSSSSLANDDRRKRHIGYSKKGGISLNIDYRYQEVTNRSPTTLLSKSIYVCGLNRNDNVNVLASERLVSYFIAGSGLDVNEHLRFVEIMEYYLSSIGSPIQDIIDIDSIIDTKELISYETITPAPVGEIYGREVIHPSVKDLGKKVNGFRYWSANTPYPLHDGTWELPSIYVSDDLVKWYPPIHGVNPLYQRIVDKHHYSDTDLIYDNELGKFFMYIRCTNFTPAASKIIVIESDDGINWNIDASQEVNNYTVVMDEPFLTPSVKKVGDKYYMYAGAMAIIKRWECDTPNGTFINPVEITGRRLTNFNHLSYLYFNEKHYLIVANTSQVYCSLLTSDDGVNFTESSQYLPPLRKSKPYENITESAQLYRPDLILLNGEVWVYYSMGTGILDTYGSICARVKLKGF